MASNRGYDAVVDVDEEGDLGHTDLHEDLEFHSSNFEDAPRSKIPSQGTFSSADGALGSKRFLWSLNFYAQFFDVDTADVLERCRATLYPRRPFLDVLDGNPDLYGPFWIATTVVFILFLAGTIQQYAASGAEGADAFHGYNIRLLSGACGLVYGYTAIVPLALWAVLRWFGSEGATALECWALYGYANLIWIPVALISWSPLTALNWVFVGIGFGASTFFLTRNLWPVVSAADAKVSRALLIIVIVLHAALAITIKFLFFAHGSPIPGDSSGSNGGNGGGKGGNNNGGGGGNNGDGDASSMLLRLLRG